MGCGGSGWRDHPIGLLAPLCKRRASSPTEARDPRSFGKDDLAIEGLSDEREGTVSNTLFA
jgi:hypothetical protein